MYAGLRRPDGKLLERLLERNTSGSHAEPARGAGQHATGAGRFGADAVIADAVVGFLIVLVATVTADCGGRGTQRATAFADSGRLRAGYDLTLRERVEHQFRQLLGRFI